MDCGPTCLRMVAKHYRKSIAIEKLRKATQIGKDGVSILGIAQAAESIGFKAVAVKTTYDELLKLPLPLILHWRQKHFVVLHKITHLNFVLHYSSFHIADPAIGKLEISKKEFLENWLSSGEGAEQKGIALVLQPEKEFYTLQNDIAENGNGKKLDWRLLKKYTFRHKTKIAIVISCLLIGSVFQFVFPYVTQNVVDKGIKNHDLTFIQLMLLAQFTLLLTQMIVEFIRSKALLFISTHINFSILSDFWKKLLKLPLSFFDSKQTGDILQRISDHRRIEFFITGAALQTIFSVVNLFIFSIILFRYNIKIFIVFAIGSLLYVGWISFFLKYRRQLDYRRFAIAASESSVTMQLVHGIHEIKLNNAENIKRKEWESLQAQLFNLGFKSLSLDQYQQAGAFFLNQGKNILISYLVAVTVVQGSLSLGAMLAIQYIIGQLNSPVEQLIGFARQAQDAKISLERLNEIHQLNNEVPDGIDLAKEIKGDRGITFNSINFTYPGAGNPQVLKNISLHFETNKTTAIVGMSGSGKTTILKLLLKFYDNYTGEIIIGNAYPLQKIDPHYWRSISGSVMQEGYIFSDTIEKNIAIADEVPDKEKLLAACRLANVLEFIESLPLGFDTKIGNAGNGISAGQRQRILIARAVYKKPEFIFFDEATNALDANNEKVIMENLQGFFKGRTVIVVAHRLSTVKNADKIVVLENGSIIEEGSHNELTNKKGKYFELVKNQLELGN